MTVPVKVLVADDHPAFLAGLRSVLEGDNTLELVGEATNGEEAVMLAEELGPDVVIMDVGMPLLDGIGAARRIVERGPHIAVLMLTMFDDDESVFLAMRAGARGYLVKGSRRDVILRAVHDVAAGGMTFGPGAARRITEFLNGPRPAAPVASNPADAFPALTERELEVLELIAAGRNNTAIAYDLGISAKTVRNHASNIFSKLLVADRSEAIIRARDAGLGT